MMLGILSAAWWAAKWTRVGQIASGPLGTAGMVVIAAVVVVGLVVGGLAWLRWDAARDARDAAEAQCRQTVLSANQRVLELQRERDEAATTAAAVERDRWIGELQAARDQLAALETQIGARKERVVCYPRAVARELNR